MAFASDRRREFPRVKLHEDFARWRDWGRTLLDLHIGYEKAKPWPVKRVDKSSPNSLGEGDHPKDGGRAAAASGGMAREVGNAPASPSRPSTASRSPSPSKLGEDRRAPRPILKSRPEEGVVVVDSETQLAGIPPEAWDYRLGNRSAIDWVLDQHKEKRPRDPTVAAKFNTYRFADHKEGMIKLLAKVVRVSMETVAIVNAMRSLDGSEDATP